MVLGLGLGLGPGSILEFTGFFEFAEFFTLRATLLCDSAVDFVE